MKFTQIYTAYILRIYYQNILGIFISSRNPRIPDWKSMDKFTDLSTIHWAVLNISKPSMLGYVGLPSKPFELSKPHQTLKKSKKSISRGALFLQDLIIGPHQVFDSPRVVCDLLGLRGLLGLLGASELNGRCIDLTTINLVGGFNHGFFWGAIHPIVMVNDG